MSEKGHPMKASSRKGSRGYSVVDLVIGTASFILIVGMACSLAPGAVPSTQTGETSVPTHLISSPTAQSIATVHEEGTTVAVVPPAFPWPPPKPSATVSVSLGSLGTTRNNVTFHDVDARISEALANAGYDERSYFGVPDGFAVVTRLEQMTSDGQPEHANRWVSEIQPMSLTEFSISEYLQALFGVPKGHYRIFVFIITSDIIVQSGTPVTQGQAQTWLVEGANRLPGVMGALPYTADHTTTVYVYEFVQSGVGETANQNIPSSLTGKQHLLGAGLWEELEK